MIVSKKPDAITDHDLRMTNLLNFMAYPEFIFLSYDPYDLYFEKCNPEEQPVNHFRFTLMNLLVVRAARGLLVLIFVYCLIATGFEKKKSGRILIIIKAHCGDLSV